MTTATWFVVLAALVSKTAAAEMAPPPRVVLPVVWEWDAGHPKARPVVTEDGRKMPELELGVFDPPVRGAVTGVRVTRTPDTGVAPGVFWAAVIRLLGNPFRRESRRPNPPAAGVRRGEMGVKSA